MKSRHHVTTTAALRHLRRSWHVLAVAFVAVAIGSCAGVPDDPFAAPDTAFATVVEGLRAQRPEVLWQALPSSYQQDVTELVHHFASTVDAEVYDRSLKIVGRAGSVIGVKKGLILSSGMLERATTDPERAAAAADAAAQLLTALAGSDLGRVETLKILDPELTLSTTGAQVMGLAAEISKVVPDDPYTNQFLHTLDNTTVELASRDGDHAVVRVQLPGRLPEEQRLVRVDERWVPEEMAARWPEVMAEARSRLSELDSEHFAARKPQVLMVLGLIEAVLAQLEAAESPEQLAAAQQAILGAIMAASMGQ